MIKYANSFIVGLFFLASAYCDSPKGNEMPLKIDQISSIAKNALIPTMAQCDNEFEFEIEGPNGEKWPTTFWYPPGLNLIMGIIIVGNGWPVAAEMPQLRAFGQNIGFGILGANGRQIGYAKALAESMKMIADKTAHSEIKNAPWVGLGNSNGAGLILDLLNEMPKSAIAVAPCAGYRHIQGKIAPLVDEALKVPAIFGVGEYESPGYKAKVHEFYEIHRKRGALWAYCVDENTGHSGSQRRLYDLFLPFLNEIIAMRYPENATPGSGRVPLKDLSNIQNWFVNECNDSRNVVDIHPWYSQPDNTQELTGWLPNERIAAIFRAAGSIRKPLDINIDKRGEHTSTDYEHKKYLFDGKVFNPQEPLSISVDTKAAQWEKIEIWRGEEPQFNGLDVWGKPSRTVFECSLSPGIYAFHAVGFRSLRSIRSVSPPIRAIVKGGPGTVHNAIVPNMGPSFFQQPPISITLPEGDRLIIPAFVKGATQYKWHKDNKPLQNGGCNIFELPHITKNDAGVYTLIAINENGETQSNECRVSVNEFAGILSAFCTFEPHQTNPADESWQKAITYKIDNTTSGSFSKSDKEAAFIQSCWDRYNLYVMVTVIDETDNIETPGPWNNDMAEIYLQNKIDDKAYYGDFGYQLVKTRKGDSALEIHHEKLPEGKEINTTEFGFGYATYFKIPFLALHMAPQGGEFIAFESRVVFAEKGGKAAFSKLNKAWMTPRSLGSIKLAKNV